MPNWCENELTVTGPVGAVDQFLADIADGDHPISFNKVLPIPQSIRDASSGSDESSHKSLFGEGLKFSFTEEAPEDYVSDHLVGEYEGWRVKELNNTLWRHLKELTPEERKGYVQRQEDLALAYKNNVERYGHTSWYGWSIANWGCKWDAIKGCVIRNEVSPKGRTKTATISFSTPWGPPTQVIHEIIVRNPSLRFASRFWEGGMAFKGVIKGKGGEVTHEESSPYSGSRGWMTPR